MKNLIVLIHLQQSFSFLGICLSVPVTERQKWGGQAEQTPSGLGCTSPQNCSNLDQYEEFFLQNIKSELSVTNTLDHAIDIPEVCVAPQNFLLPKAVGAQAKGCVRATQPQGPWPNTATKFTPAHFIWSCWCQNWTQCSRACQS